MKKLKFSIIVAITVVMLTMALSVSATNAIGSVIGQAVKTDIAAYINNYPIQSYNIDGYTAVVAEDLAEYGFTVVWDGNARSLSITENSNAKAIITSKAVTKSPASDIGKKALDVLSTDIKTYINGKQVEGRNVNGRTIISFEDLSVYGNVKYDNEKRALFLSLDRLPTKSYVPVATSTAATKNDTVGNISANAYIDAIASTNVNGETVKSETKMSLNVGYDFVTGVIHLDTAVLKDSETVNLQCYAKVAESGIDFFFYSPEIAPVWIKESISAEEFGTLPSDLLGKKYPMSTIALASESAIAGGTFVGDGEVCGKAVKTYAVNSLPGLKFSVDEQGIIAQIEGELSMYIEALLKSLNIEQQDAVTFEKFSVRLTITGFNSVAELAIPSDVEALAINLSAFAE